MMVNTRVLTRGMYSYGLASLGDQLARVPGTCREEVATLTSSEAESGTSKQKRLLQQKIPAGPPYRRATDYVLLYRLTSLCIKQSPQ